MQNAIEVHVNSTVSLYPTFDTISDSELRVASSVGDIQSLGAQVVAAHGPSGYTTGTFDVVVPATPEVEWFLQSLFGFDLDLVVEAAFEPGWTSVLVWSYSDATFPQGSLDLLQGASVASTGTLDAVGYDITFWSPYSAGITLGETIYLQLVMFDPATAARAASKVVEVLVAQP